MLNRIERVLVATNRWLLIILLLAKPRYFLLPEMKNGYCKGSQVFHYVRGVLAVQEQLGRNPGKGERK